MNCIDEFLEAQCGQLRDLKSPGGPSYKETLQFCVICFQEFAQVSLVNAGGKFPHASGRGRGKATILKFTRALCFSLEGQLLGEAR